MEMSGLILDVYDDFKGEVLRSLYGVPETLPDFVKAAQALSTEDHQRLPDECFALILQNGDQVLRKFACIDEGNTALSVQYFIKNAHKLPEEAQKTAAANLLIACSWYDLAAPEPLSKIAEMTGTSLMPHQSPSDKTIGGEKTVVKKAGMGHLLSGHKGETEDFGPEEGRLSHNSHAKTPQRLPQARLLHPHVNVTEKKASQEVITRAGQYYALPSEEKYPLDDYRQIKTAGVYFEEFHRDFKPAHRHEYAVNLLKRASAVGLTMGDMALRYGNQKYASHDGMQVAYEVRDKECAWDETGRGMLQELFEKRAELDPEVFALALGEFDKTAGLTAHYDGLIPDPFLSTFGMDKTAEPVFREVIGNDTVTDRPLYALAAEPKCGLGKLFDDDFVSEFRKDPVAIFKSMPRDQKKIIMRMANETTA